jgi:NAD+ synthase (glutamine-hydrolysing)
VSDITKHLLVTAYLGTANSTAETQNRAKGVSDFIGNEHVDSKINNIYLSCVKFIKDNYGLNPRYKVEGGSYNEDIAL